MLFFWGVAGAYEALVCKPSISSRKLSKDSGRGSTANPHGLLRVPATTAGGRSPQLVSRDEVVRENKRAVRRRELWQRQRWQGKDSDSDWD